MSDSTSGMMQPGASSDVHSALDVSVLDEDCISEAGKSSSSGGQPFGSPNPSEADDPNDPDGKPRRRRHKADQPSTPRSTFPMSERQQLAFLKKIMTPEHSAASSDRASISPRSPSSTPGLSATPTSTPQSSKRCARPNTVDRRNDRGETRLHVAARRGEHHRCKQLIEQGATVDAVDNAGWTPLHEACNHSCYKAAKVLLMNGANVNAAGMGDDTPLHDAAANNNRKVISLLLRSGACTSMRNAHGKVPADLATDPTCVQLLNDKQSASAATDSQESDIVSAEEESQDAPLASPAVASDHEDFNHQQQPLLSTDAFEPSALPNELPPALAAAMEQQKQQQQQEVEQQKQSMAEVEVQPRRLDMTVVDTPPDPMPQSQSTTLRAAPVSTTSVYLSEGECEAEEPDEAESDMTTDRVPRSPRRSDSADAITPVTATPLRRSTRGVRVRVIRSPPGSSPTHRRHHVRSPTKSSSATNVGAAPAYALVRRRREFQRCKRKHQQQVTETQRVTSGTGRRKGRPPTRQGLSKDIPLVSPSLPVAASPEPEESVSVASTADDPPGGAAGVFDFHDSDSDVDDSKSHAKSAKQQPKSTDARKTGANSNNSNASNGQQQVMNRKRRLLGDATGAEADVQPSKQHCADKQSDAASKKVPPLKLLIGPASDEADSPSQHPAPVVVVEDMKAVQHTTKERTDSGSSRSDRTTRRVKPAAANSEEQQTSSVAASVSAPAIHPKKRTALNISRSALNLSGRGRQTQQQQQQSGSGAPPAHWSQTVDALPCTDTLLAGNSYKARSTLNHMIERRWFEHNERYQELRCNTTSAVSVDCTKFMTHKKSYLLYERWKKEQQDVKSQPPKDLSDANAAVSDMLFERQQQQRDALATEHRVQRDRLQVSFEHQVQRVSTRHGHSALRPLSCTRIARDTDLCNVLELDAVGHFFNRISATEKKSAPISVAATAHEAMMSLEKLLDKVISKYNKQKNELQRRHELESLCLRGSQCMQWQSAYRKASHLSVHDACPTPSLSLVPAVHVVCPPDITGVADIDNMKHE